MQSVHTLLEQSAAANSAAVFTYDAELSFGSSLESSRDVAIYKMQTRAGAGAALVGYVQSAAFSSKGVDNTKPVTVLASTDSFLSLVPSLLALPSNDQRPAATFHVSAQASSLNPDREGEPTLVQVPQLGAVLEGAKELAAGGWTGAVVFSESPEDAASVGTGLARTVANAGYDLVNVFDGLTTGRQLDSSLAPSSAASSAGSLEETLAAAIPFFTYSGSNSATKVLVLPASAYSASAKAAVAASDNADVGVLSVRVLKPWNSQDLFKVLPESAKSLHAFTEEGETNGALFEEVLASVYEAASPLKVRSLPVSTSTVPTVAEWAERAANIAGKSAGSSLKSLLPAQAKLAVFWDLDASSGETEKVTVALATAFSGASTGVVSKLDVRYDNFRQGGVQQAALLLEAAGASHKESFSLSSIGATSPPSLLFLANPAAVLKAYEAISTSTVSSETRIVVSANWNQQDFATKLPYAARKALVELANGGKGHLFVIDADKIAKAQQVRAADVAEIVFWTLYLPSTISAKDLVSLLAQTPSFSNWKSAKLVEVNGAVRNALEKITVEASWADEPVDEDGNRVELPARLPTSLIATASGPNPDRTFPEPTATIVGTPSQSWHSAAHRLLFPEAFGAEERFEEKLRPDLPEKNFLITVTENRRLTPNTYDRNVFHIEFSTEGTGLKYAIGEALGIHGWNDADEVNEFLAWYGLDPEAVISLPSRVDPSRIEQRTVFQVFQQNLDIFGKPGKSFYETLSKYATNKNEERALRFIACPDGSATFKKMSEMDTVTYADLLRQFPSAKPTLEDLVREIEEIHPRHYSIASSQNFVGDSVHLLIVTVDWQTPTGESESNGSSFYVCVCVSRALTQYCDLQVRLGTDSALVTSLVSKRETRSWRPSSLRS